MLCDKCGQAIMDEGRGAIMAEIRGGWIITEVKVQNCPSCDFTKAEVVTKE